MRTPATVALALLIASAAFTGNAQGPTGCHAPRDACSLFDRFLGAFNRREWDAFRVTLSDDVSAMLDSPDHPERLDGRVAVEEFFHRIFPPAGSQPSHLPPPVQPEKLLVQDLGDTVVISFHIRFSDTIARRTLVLRKTALGWRVVHIHGSSFDLPAH
jgi:hypothetical protein